MVKHCACILSGPSRSFSNKLILQFYNRIILHADHKINCGYEAGGLMEVMDCLVYWTTAVEQASLKYAETTSLNTDQKINNKNK